MKVPSWVVLLIFVGVCESVGFLGSIFTAGEIAGWYADLLKPEWVPPNYIFAPVWTVLYALMGFSAWLVWKDKKPFKEREGALWVFLIQLILNGIWTPIFFGAHEVGIALAVIVVLLGAVALTTVLFYRINKLAGLLFVPYLAWVGFATALNASILMLN